MSRRGRRIWLLVMGVLASGLGVAAIAWACTPNADIHVDRASGPPGTVVTMTGNGFSTGPVEIRFGTVTSAPLATVNGPSFSVQVTIPQTAPGWHYFNATGYDEETQKQYQPSASFLVTGAEAEQPAGQQQPQQPAAARPQPAERPSERAGARARAEQRAAPERRPAVQRATPTPTASVSAEPTPAPAEPVVRAMPDPEPAAAPSAARRESQARSRPAAAQPFPERLAPVPGSSTPDPNVVWSPRRGAATEDASAGPNAQIAIGAGLLAVGLVALFGGFAVAEVRRRRAPAGSRRRR